MVCRRREVIEIKDNGLTAGHDHVAIRSKTADAVVSRDCGDGVIQIEEIVSGEVGIEGDAEQSAFAVRVDIQREKRCWK